MSDGIFSNKRLILGISGRTLIWWLWNIIYGLIPLWVVLLAIQLPTRVREPYKFEYARLLEGGIINFFCLAIMGAVGVDILLSRIELNKRFKNWMIAGALTPFVFMILIYATMVAGFDGIHSFGTIIGIRWALCIYTFLYCTIGKFVLFLNEKA